MCLPTLSCNQTNLQCQIFANRILDNIKLNKKQHNCSDPKLTHEEGGCDVVIPLQVLECSSCLLPVIEHNIRCNQIAPRLSKSFNSSLWFFPSTSICLHSVAHWVKLSKHCSYDLIKCRYVDLVTDAPSNQWTVGSRSSGRARTVFPEEVSDEEVIDDAGPCADGDVQVVRLLPKAVEVVVPLRVFRLPRRLLRQPPAPRFSLLAAGGRRWRRGGGRAPDWREATPNRGSGGGAGAPAAGAGAGEVGVGGGGGDGGGGHGGESLRQAAVCAWLCVWSGGRWEARTALLALSVTVVQENRRTQKNINF